MAEPVWEFVSRVEMDEPARATGHVVTKMAWEDRPDGKRRPSETPELDEHGRPQHVLDVMLPFGRDGQPLVFGVTVASHEVPAPEPYSLVEFEGLRARVKQHRSGKGVEISFTAEGVRPAAGGPQRGSRRQAEGEAA